MMRLGVATGARPEPPRSTASLRRIAGMWHQWRQRVRWSAFIQGSGVGTSKGPPGYRVVRLRAIASRSAESASGRIACVLPCSMSDPCRKEVNMLRSTLGSLATLLLAASMLDAQTPAFESADVFVRARPTTASRPMSGGLLRNGRYDLRNATMVDLVATAYGVTPESILGGPSWL